MTAYRGQAQRGAAGRPAARIRTYAGDDTTLNGIAMSVSEAVREYGESMSSDQMKGCFYQVQYSMRDRDTEGKSKRPGK